MATRHELHKEVKKVGEKKSPLFSIPPNISSHMHKSHILLMKLTTSPALPGPEEKTIVNSSVPIATKRNSAVVIYPMPLTPPENNSLKETGYESRTCEPIIEEPATPERESIEIKESNIKDSFYEDHDEITTIKLNSKEFTVKLQNYIQEKNELQEGDMSKALVALNPDAASIPTPKSK